MQNVLIGALLLAASSALAETAPQMLARYEAEARGARPAFEGFSAARGERFFKATHGAEWSCASCHGASPTAQGRHAKTGKAIAPLAPSAAPERFADAAKVEKWFKRNCNDVLSRPCTVEEKGDVLAFLLRAK